MRLWNDVHTRDLATDPSISLRATFDTGQKVGELACKRYKGGQLVAQDHLHIAEALAETRRVLELSTTTTLFEAAFEYQGLFSRADIIERLGTGGWRLVEVKSSTSLKDVFVLDVAFQLSVLRGAGLDVREATVMTLDRSYVYDGKTLDLERLFKFHDVMEQCETILDSVNGNARMMQTLIGTEEPPNIQTGNHCYTPYDCPYYEHCSRDDVHPDHGIDELPSLRSSRRAQLNEAGVEEILDVPEDFPLTSLQRIVRQAVLEQESVVHGDISAMLSEIKHPVKYLDFETFAPPIPRFVGTSPYDAIPFLFSVHTECAHDTIRHTDYLHELDDDPRPNVVERLIETVGDEGSICTYSNYERTVLKSLATAIPERADEIAAISSRWFDLHRVVKNSIYHPEFRGSFSIKSVLPVLVPGMGYDDLEIVDGQTASVLYMQALENRDKRKRQQTFANLRAYCERDTLALVGLHDALKKL
ncbi:MAG: DUF2779 domain-containing protein [Gammaproteobacteria bacterium]|nr:DUF2779 domain-containing protein [Gammaproteobacteria bacterium]